MQEINLELPGIKLRISGLWPLTIFLIIVLSIFGTSVYLVSNKDRAESVSQVISSFGGVRSDSPKAGVKDALEFFIPDGEAYESGKQEFEQWLSNNNGWWSKTPMTNTMTYNGEEVILTGYKYSLENPIDDSPLTQDAPKTIHNLAVKMLGVKDLDTIWVEIVSDQVR